MRANEGRGAARWAVVLATTLAVAGCDGGAPAPEDGGEAVEGAPAAGRASATVDTSAPPPGSLLAIMIDLERDMAGVAHGIWWSDWEAIAASATGIAEHPKIPDEDRVTIAETLGEEMADFAGLDRDVHDASVRIGEAAAEEDLEGVLDAWQAAQDGCVECHQRFRERLRPVLSGAGSPGSGEGPGR